MSATPNDLLKLVVWISAVAAVAAVVTLTVLVTLVIQKF